MRLSLTTILSLTLLAGCNGSDGTPSPVGQVDTPVAKLKLKNFDACADFQSYAADAFTEQYLQPIYCLADGFAPCPVYAGAPTANDGNAGGGTGGEGAPTAAPDRVSSTNTQEEGVDEADIVKADAAGNLYVISGRTLSVLQAFPPQGLEARELTTLSLADEGSGFYASDFFLDETAQRLVVMATEYTTRSQSINVIIDISNPAAPAEVARLAIDGYGLEARRIGDRVHRVSRFDVPTPSWFNDSSDSLHQKRQQYQEARNRGDEQEAERIKAEVRTEIGNRVEAAGASALLPNLSATVAGNTTQSQMSCSDIAHPEVTAGMGIALVDSFSTMGALRAASGVINNAWVVYGSAQNLYLAQSSFGWFWDPAQSEQTAIYRLALSPSGAAQYRGVGMVDGSVISRYALSEYNNALRVATTETISGRDANTTRNGVTVLDASGTDMPALGAISNLAPGERIQGVRFVGDRGYVVTFRQVDPLFALDLANPAQPVVTDELKIPGFSSYLLPLGNDYLLTIGRAGDEQQLSGQVGIQLFSVQDPRHITQLASVSPSAGGGSSYSYSSAEYDPHAFSYFADSDDAPVPGTLSVPLQSYDWNNGGGFSGFLVMRVDPAAAQPLRELGRISHAGFAEGETQCSDEGAGSSYCYDVYYSADPRRSVFMQDAQGTYLFTLSTLGVIASDAAAPASELGRHSLPHDEFVCCYAEPAAAR